MSRTRLALIAAATFAAFGVPAASAYDGGLVRIEPKPYYGAVVTMEHGVRVYRPLPTQNLMIINPNKTPVSLSFSRTIEHKAAERGDGGNGNGGGRDGDNGSRYGGISGLGNVTGTNPQATGEVVGNGGRSGLKRHVRRSAHH
jgi:hypothetical protein